MGKGMTSTWMLAKAHLNDERRTDVDGMENIDLGKHRK